MIFIDHYYLKMIIVQKYISFKYLIIFLHAMRKFTIMALFVIASAASGMLYQSASAADFTAEEQDWLDANSVISVGSSVWPPYEYLDDNGNLAGITAAMAERFSQITNATFSASETAAGNWTATLAGLPDGTVDVAFMIEDTQAENREGIGFTQPWFPVDTHIITSDTTDRGAITAQNLADHKIVVVEGYAVVTWLAENNIQSMIVDSTAEALRGVANGTYDAHIENWEVAYRIGVQNEITGLVNAGPSGHTYQNAIGYDADNPILGSIMEKILYEIGSDGISKIVDAAILSSNAQLIKESFSPEEQRWLEQNPRIYVGSSIWPPYEYLDDNGNQAGVSAAIAKRFSQITGATFVESPTAKGDWTATLAGLRDGTVNVAFMIEDTGAPNRAGIDFTTPWLYVGTHVIVSDDDADTTYANLADKKIVSVRDYAVNSWLDAQGIPYTTVSSTAEALRGVADGIYDVHIENWEVASILASKEKITGLANNDASGFEYALSIGYTPSNTDLGSILQKVLYGIQGEQDMLVADAVRSSTAELSRAAYDIEFTTAEHMWLDQNPEISVGSSVWTPYEYLDDNGNLAGITAAMAERFSQITGSEFVESETAAGNWTATLAGLPDGTVHVAFMIEDTQAENREGIGFTQPWFLADTHIITSDTTTRGTITAQNLADYKIVVVEGYAVVTWLANSDIPYMTVASTAEALRGVANGTYDAHIENWEVAYRIGVQNEITGLVNAGPSGHTYQNAIGYDADNPVLGNIMQKILDGIGSDGISKIVDAAILASNAQLIRESFTDDEQNWLKQNQQIKVGSSIWPPYEYLDDNGNQAGVSAAIAKRFSQITGATFVESPTAKGDWTATLAGLRDGTVNVAFMIEDAPSDDRRGIAFTTPWLYVGTHVIVSDDDTATTDANLADKKIVSVSGYAVNSWLDAQGIPYTTVSSTAEALRGVADGTYDAHIENWEVASILASNEGIFGLDNNGASGFEYALSIGYTQNNAVLGSLLQKVLDGIQGEQDMLVADAVYASTAELSRIGAAHGVAFTDAEIEWLAEHPVIIVGHDPGWPPYEYRDANDRFSGSSAALAERFSEISRSQFFQADSVDSWQDSLDAFRNGNVDVMMAIEDTSERRESYNMDFTSVWLTIPIDIITTESQKNAINSGNLKDYRVVVVQGYAVTSWLDENMPELDYTIENDAVAALRMVTAGDADAYLEQWDIVNYLAIQNNINGLADAGPLGDTYALSMGYQKDNPLLGSILQKMINATSNERDQIVQDAVERSNNALATLPFTPTEQAWLDAHPTVKFGYDPALIHVSEVVAERLTAISGSIFVASDSVTSWQDSLDGMRDGSIDTILAIERNSQREEYMDFTSAWYVIPVDIVTRESQKNVINRNNLDDYRVVAVQGYAVEAWLATYMPDLEYVAVPNTLVALTMLVSGQADAYLEPWQIAGHIATLAGITGLTIAEPLGDDYVLAFGYTEGDDTFGSLLQKMVNEIQDENDELVQESINRALGSAAPGTSAPRICR